MAKFPLLSESLSTIKEIDLKPIQQQALEHVRIALVGAPGSGRHTLANQMRRDPARLGAETDAPVSIIDLERASVELDADLIILVVRDDDSDTSLQQELVQGWANSDKKTLVFINQFAHAGDGTGISPWTRQRRRRVAWGSALDSDFLLKTFAPAVMELLPDKILSLGRNFPLFRSSISQYLINDTCFSNAAYALSTGLAETLGVFNLPITVADAVVLTKTQAYLVYKLGLALGYSTRWQDYVGEFGSVLGSSFIWRQLARSLVGLIPVWGIVPKVAISYAGTYVVGHAVNQWYLTGKHISRSQMQDLYTQALAKGKNAAGKLIKNRPRLHLPKPKIRLLPAGKKKKKTCNNCGKVNTRDSNFCKACGMPLGTLDGEQLKEPKR